MVKQPRQTITEISVDDAYTHCHNMQYSRYDSQSQTHGYQKYSTDVR